MKTSFIFYLFGFSLFIHGVLALLGVELPLRNGTIACNPSLYGKQSILFAIIIFIITFLLTMNKKE